MLESMIVQPASDPCRSERCQRTAVLDTTDALMLSGETASGAHPVEAVRTMARIIEEIEKSAYYKAQRQAASNIQLEVPANAIAHAAVIAASSMKLKTIVTILWTRVARRGCSVNIALTRTSSRSPRMK